MGICPGVGLSDQIVALFLAFKKISILFIVTKSTYSPTTVQESSLFSTPSLAFIVSRFFLNLFILTGGYLLYNIVMAFAIH